MGARGIAKRLLAGALAAALLATALPGGALAAAPQPPDSLSVLTDELGNTALCGYDEEENCLYWFQGPEDTAETCTRYTYDEAGQLAAVEKTVGGLAGGLDGVASQYMYDGAGRLTGLAHSNTAASSTDYRFRYDAAGRMTEAQVGGRTLVDYRYDGDGESPAETVYANGDTHICQYDAAGRLTASRWSGSAQAETQYRYDDAGRLAAIDQGPGGQRVRCSYDEAGQLMEQMRTADGFAQQVQWTYSGDGQLAAVTEMLNGASRTTALAYDGPGRLVAVECGGASAAYTYSGGQLAGQTLLYQGAPVLTRSVEYLPGVSGQSSSRVAVWRNAAAGCDTSYRYTYDGNGNIRSVSDGTYTTCYTYDEAGQLVREDNERAGKSWTWTYDAGGNRVQAAQYAYTTGALGEPERTTDYAYGGDGWGDLLQSRGGQALAADAVGNLLSNGTWSCRWAFGRQLAGMTDGSRELTFRYDADGLRSEKAVDGVVWRYAYVDGRLTGMTNGTDTLRFVRDGEGAAFLDYNGTVYAYLRDLQGNVVGLLDAAGEPVVEYAYDAWGVPLAVTGPLADTLGQLNPLRYRGYVYDPETGLYYLDSRYYDPELGRFLSADGGVAAPGGALLGGNLFAYGLNDPVNTRDPEGSWPRWITAGFAALSAALALRQQSMQAALTALAATAVYRLQVVHFDVREALNIDIPLTREEAIAAGWLGPDTDPVGPSALLHQFTSTVFGENVKYVSPDGCREAIYDAWGKLIADVRDIGTYNFSPSGTLWGDIRHFFVDMLPWMIFGNGDKDPGPLLDGLLRLFK